MTAMEKYHWDTQEIPDYLKRELDTRFGCSWHVVVGEDFGFDVDVEVRKLKLTVVEIIPTQEGQLLYIFFGSLAVLLWKCGTQLLKEVKYKKQEEEEQLKKAKLISKGTSKYAKVFYS